MGVREQAGLFDTHVLKPVSRAGYRPDDLPEIASRGIKLIALDDETTGKDKWTDRPVGTAVSLPDGADYYIPSGHLGGGNHDPAKVREWKRRELRDCTIVNLNTGFDSECERNDGLDLEKQNCKLIDVAHLAALLDEHRFAGFNLNSLGKEFVGRGKVECPVAGKDIHRVHAAEVAPYARGDSRLALDVYLAQVPRIKAEGLEAVAELESNLIYVVNEMERNGLPVDLPKLAAWRRRIGEEIAEGQMELWRMTGIRCNPNSPHDLLKLFKQLGLQYVDAKADTLKHVKHPAIQKVLWIKQRLSLRSKYLDKYWSLAKDSGLLRTAFHQLRAADDENSGETGTITGRFSSSGGDGWGINCQQVMKPSKQRKRMGPDYIVRELIVPDTVSCPGAVWVSSDAMQIEFRLFGEYAKNPMMIEAYRADPLTDFYAFTVKLLKAAADYDISRDDTKVLALAAIYAQGRQKRMDGLGVDEARLDVIDNAWDNAFPEAKKLLRKAMRIAEDRGYVMTRLGRRGRFPDNDRYYRALNKVLQGTAADIMKMKLRRLYDEREALELTMRATVHDEFDGDLRNPSKLARFEEVMSVQEFDDMKIPILWETGTGANWMEAGD